MIRRYWEVSCDYCNSAIAHYMFGGKRLITELKDEGAIVVKGNHYCNMLCLEKSLKAKE